jgi:hypothetical protein
MKIQEAEIAAAERYAFAENVRAWAREYALGFLNVPEDSGYAQIYVRMLATRLRKNGIVELANIKTVLDVMLIDEITPTANVRLMQILLNPMMKENAKMDEIFRQFRGKKPSLLSGFRMWKMR